MDFFRKKNVENVASTTTDCVFKQLSQKKLLIVKL